MQSSYNDYMPPSPIISSKLFWNQILPLSKHGRDFIFQNVFQDNKNIRAVDLESQFSQIKVESFKDMMSYCQEIKIVAGQLASVDAPVTNNRLVLQLIVGLNDTYNGVAIILQQNNPLSDSLKQNHALYILEETNRSKQMTTNIEHALDINNTTGGFDQTQPANAPRGSSCGCGNNGRRGGGRGRNPPEQQQQQRSPHLWGNYNILLTLNISPIQVQQWISQVTTSNLGETQIQLGSLPQEFFILQKRCWFWF